MERIGKMSRINTMLLVDPTDTRYIVGCKAVLEEELVNLTLASSEYEQNYILSVIFKTINLLEMK